MRILHLIHTPRQSGAEALVSSLCKLHRAWGHECAIASFSPPEPGFMRSLNELKSIEVEIFFPSKPKRKFGRISHFRSAICQFRPDVVFAHSELPSIYGRFATGFGKSRVRFVSVLHSATENDFASTTLKFNEVLTRFRVDHIVAVSDRAAKNYMHRFGKSIPVSVIPNGIDLSLFSNIDRTAARVRLGLDVNDILALQVGRVSPVKQQNLTLKALRPQLEAERLILWFAGLTEEVAYEDELHSIVRQWNIESRVRFLGSRSDVPDLLAAADLYLMPSKQESQGIAMLEALASGIPIVASNIPAFRFAETMPSVNLCDVTNDAAYAAAIIEALMLPRSTRDISEYSIEQTANEYLRL